MSTPSESELQTSDTRSVSETQAPSKVVSHERIDLDADPTPEAVADDEWSRRLSEGESPPEIEGYEFVRMLGKGGHAVVWLAKTLQDGVPVQVAVKVLLGNKLATSKFSELQNEVQALARVREDPGVVRIFKADPGYIVMRYAEGGSLRDQLEKVEKGEKERTPTTLPLERAEELFRALCETMAYVHERGICHCDLKPHNVLLDGRGKPLIADFGQAYLQTGTSLPGTFFYMCPEQADPNNTLPDPSWDVYSLGAVFYRCLTTRAPREESSLRSELKSLTFYSEKLKLYRDRLRRAPRPEAHHQVAGMDPELADIIDRCLSIEPARRYRDAGAVVAALKERTRAHREQARRRHRLLAFGGVLLGLIVAAAVVGVQGYSEFKREIYKEIEQNDRETARLAANAVRGEFDRRISIVRQHAAHPALREALRPDPGKPALEAAGLIALGDPLSALVYEATKRSPLPIALFKFHQWHRNGDGSHPFDRWFVADRHGRMLERLAVDPERPNAIKWGSDNAPHFRWREWFNGDSDVDENADPDARIKPHEKKFHLTEPFISYFDKRRLVTISVPIYADDRKGPPIGILGASIFCNPHLRQWLASQDGNSVGSFSFALIDHRGSYLIHPSEKQVDEIGESLIRDENVARPYEEQLEFLRSPPDRLERDYEDPVDGRKYLATFALVEPACQASGPRLNLTVSIRRDPDKVNGPLEGFAKRTLAIGAGLLAFAVGSCLVFFRYFQEKRAAQGG